MTVISAATPARVNMVVTKQFYVGGIRDETASVIRQVFDIVRV
jgi:hypothetical protein